MGKFDDVLVGGVVGAASQLGVGLLNNAMSQHNAREQREWQEKMWKQQNAYNDPSAVAARMRRAGLNPYGELSATPAGSAGTGAVADTVPLSDPLSALKTIADVENINASTGRIETETEKIFKEIAQLDIFIEHGLMSNEEYRRRLKELYEEWDKYNPYTVERERTQAAAAADTAAAGASDASAAASEALAAYTDAQRVTEELLRPEKLSLLKSQDKAARAAAVASFAQATASEALAAYNNALADKASTEAAVAAALKDVDIRIGKLKENGIVTENQLKRYQAEKERIIRNPDGAREGFLKLEFLLRDIL